MSAAGIRAAKQIAIEAAKGCALVSSFFCIAFSIFFFSACVVWYRLLAHICSLSLVLIFCFLMFILFIFFLVGMQGSVVAIVYKVTVKDYQRNAIHNYYAKHEQK